jgi:transcriptional regulator with XRE-family HTH domain
MPTALPAHRRGVKPRGIAQVGPRLTGPDLATLGGRIRYLRESANETQRQLASALGVARTSVLYWESGEGAKAARVREIAQRYGVATDWVLAGDGAAPRLAGKPAKIHEITEIHNGHDGRQSGAQIWVVPPLKDYPEARAWRAQMDFTPFVARGDTIFIVEAGSSQIPDSIYLVEVGKKLRQLVLLRAHLRADGTIAMHDARDNAIDQKALKRIVGRVVGRYGSL